MKIEYNLNSNTKCLTNIVLKELSLDDIKSKTLTIDIPNFINETEIYSIGIFNYYDKKGSIFIKYEGPSEYIDKISSIEFKLKNGPKIIKSLNLGVFENCKVKINIPNSIETIDHNAFQKIKFDKISFDNYSNLTYINAYSFEGAIFNNIFELPTSCTIINEFAFANADFKKGITFPQKGSKLTTINEFAFCWSNLNTKTIEFPDSLIRINRDAFKNTQNIDNVFFSKNSKIEFLGIRAFEGSSVKSVIINSNKSELIIHECCFCNCYQLTIMDLSNTNITYIPQYFCYHADNLKTLKLPDSLKLIEKQAFIHCNIKTIDLKNPFCNIMNNSFDNQCIEDLKKIALFSDII